jgi:short-subunit dehydrogenase
MKDEKGTALITGASSGIGRELARLLGARKHPLVLLGRDHARLQEVAASIEADHGAKVWTICVDLSRPGAARDVFEFTRKNGIDIELLINNAGVGLYGEHADIPLDRVGQMLQLNVGALSDLCLLYAAEMRLRRSGRIMNVASTAAYQPTPYVAAYGASKAFVLNFSEALAMELADYGVTVTCLSPGPTDTAFFGDMDADGVQNAHFAKAGRRDARAVAEIGFQAMMAGELSRIVGAKDYLRVWATRLTPRALVARISKGMMRPSRLPQLGGARTTPL